MKFLAIFTTLIAIASALPIQNIQTQSKAIQSKLSEITESVDKKVKPWNVAAAYTSMMDDVLNLNKKKLQLPRLQKRSKEVKSSPKSQPYDWNMAALRYKSMGDLNGMRYAMAMALMQKNIAPK
jgi:hypothetical protein